jgi:hypothetical protein
MSLTNEVQRLRATKQQYPIFYTKEVGIMVRTGDINDINTWINYFFVQTPQTPQTPSGWKMVYSQWVVAPNSHK